MSDRLIPRSDDAFASKIRGFSSTVAKDPERFNLPAKEVDAVIRAAERFTATLQASRYGDNVSPAATRVKNEARAEAETAFKRCHKLLRVNENLDAGTRASLQMNEPSKKKRPRTVPQSPPAMRFLRALHVAHAATPIHEISFCEAGKMRGPKPDGAVRLELFVGLVRADEPVPPTPRAHRIGWSWYVRSFSKSPIRVAPPMPRIPMLVVYWGRWADATGDFGPWSKTVVTRVEGYSPHMPQDIGFGGRKVTPILEDKSCPARPENYSVAVRDAQYEYFNQSHVEPAAELPAPQDEPAQLEGPGHTEAEAA